MLSYVEKKILKEKKQNVKECREKKSNTSQEKNPSNRIVKILTIFPPPFLIDQNSSIDFNYSETRQNEMNKKKQFYWNVFYIKIKEHEKQIYGTISKTQMCYRIFTFDYLLALTISFRIRINDHSRDCIKFVFFAMILA